MTNITVKNYTAVYMYIEIIMCHYQMSSDMFLIPQTHRIEGTSKCINRRRHMEESLPAFRVILQNPSYSKYNIPNLPKLLKYGHYTSQYLSI